MVKKVKNNPYIDDNYIPCSLPCGRKINQDWKLGDPVESCMTVCSQKSTTEIDQCYRQCGRNKKKISERFGEDLPDTSGKHRLFYH